jgi:hypothetical protein
VFSAGQRPAKEDTEAPHRREWAWDRTEENHMTDATSEPGEGSKSTAGTNSVSRARRAVAAITPGAALGRHIEWLEFALAAARSEESWRVARVEKATKKNRDKRATRLDEVRDEILELAALVDAIRGLQAKAAPRTGGRSAKARAAAPRKRAATTARKRPSSSGSSSTPAATSTPSATPATAPKAKTAKASTPARTRAAAAKPAAGSIKRSASTRKRSTTTKAIPRKASTTGATPRRRASKASTAPTAAATPAGQA